MFTLSFIRVPHPSKIAQMLLGKRNFMVTGRKRRLWYTIRLLLLTYCGPFTASAALAGLSLQFANKTRTLYIDLGKALLRTHTVQKRPKCRDKSFLESWVANFDPLIFV